MLRIIHTQVAAGPHYLTDIDDGLPRQTAKDGVGDPKRVQLDGSVLSGVDKSTKPGVNYLKQPCYVPRVKATDPSVAGYIDLKETDRVLMSQAKGCIRGLQAAGHISVVSYAPSDIAAPTLTTAVIDDPNAGDLTLTGTTFLSVSPEVTTVIITGDGAVTLTAADILTGGGTVTATSIVIPAALIPNVAATDSSVQVRANAQLTSVVVVTV